MRSREVVPNTIRAPVVKTKNILIGNSELFLLTTVDKYTEKLLKRKIERGG